MTHPGRVRSVNEDQFLVAELRKSLVVHHSSIGGVGPSEKPPSGGGTAAHVLLVADGLGGHAAGRMASELAVQEVVEHLLAANRLDLQQGLPALAAKCHTRIRSVGAEIPGCSGMGTTLTLAYVLWPALDVVHLGHSRCYLVRASGMEQLTRDHTKAQQLVESGVLQPEEARRLRWNRVLWNVLGGNSDDVETDVQSRSLRRGDALVLCTDGLTQHLEDEQILAIVGGEESPQTACEKLIDAANDAGGKDNITVVIARLS
jgi:protein phosphatase